MKDIQGREYAKKSELKAGDTVTVDGDFDCIRPWTQHTVKGTEASGLYLSCDDGLHFLDGQLGGDADSLVGIYKGVVSK